MPDTDEKDVFEASILGCLTKGKRIGSMAWAADDLRIHRMVLMARILALRYGDSPWTLEEVGREFQVTRERIRQIESHALRYLRQPSRRLCVMEAFERGSRLWCALYGGNVEEDYARRPDD
ncbi:MAG: hypothetical protein A2Z21_09335 [Candidatus Fraserbacteria bacterium RBG_16_55_9]|uniref:RNA polymerase sigma-70 domain-containing protein n=1 Tax=Fraserbacteria sp. (strain RBG_16_55_9) TaxID=1817864 RepID=A0A1F5US20_FRAXR|nr:MAG: hypothetical protein A2Z21_09335 [Candidatus Fraserbacteria bacterium RBG_16_55_9]